MEFPIAGLVAITADGVQLGEESGHALQLLPSTQPLGGHRRRVGGFNLAFLGHAGIVRKSLQSRKCDIAPHPPPGANGVPNGIAYVPFFFLAFPLSFIFLNFFLSTKNPPLSPFESHLISATLSRQAAEITASIVLKQSVRAWIGSLPITRSLSNPIRGSEK